MSNYDRVWAEFKASCPPLTVEELIAVQARFDQTLIARSALLRDAFAVLGCSIRNAFQRRG